MLISKIDSKSALGSVLCACPTVSDFSINPLDVIKTGDTIDVNADEGIVQIINEM